MEYYGTLGPSCANEKILTEMFAAGMTGLRLNTSHGRLADREEWLRMADAAAGKTGKPWELLIDLRGPELRIGHLEAPFYLEEGRRVILAADGTGDIPVPEILFRSVAEGQTIWLDDGRLRLCVQQIDPAGQRIKACVMAGGQLLSDKSLAIEGLEVPMPALTAMDLENIRYAGRSDMHLSAVMQPFVRSRQDLMDVRKVLDENGCTGVKIMAKIENTSGVRALPELLPACDSVVIARGDLGTAVSLPKLPVVQKQIEACCRRAEKPYMVVTQLLHSMMENPVPTRAEVSDIANAVFGGAASLMLTGETAAGRYPVEAMACLVATAEEAIRYMKDNSQVK